MEDLLVQLAVAIQVVLVEGLAVIGGEDHDGLVEDTARFELLQELAEERIHGQDRLVVGGDEGRGRESLGRRVVLFEGALEHVLRHLSERTGERARQELAAGLGECVRAEGAALLGLGLVGTVYVVGVQEQEVGLLARARVEPSQGRARRHAQPPGRVAVG